MGLNESFVANTFPDDSKVFAAAVLSSAAGHECAEHSGRSHKQQVRQIYKMYSLPIGKPKHRLSNFVLHEFLLES